MNSVKCLQCGAILISTHTHDFRMCSCDNQTFCDGGDDYSRVGGADFKKIAVYNNDLKEYIKMDK